MKPYAILVLSCKDTRAGRSVLDGGVRKPLCSSGNGSRADRSKRNGTRSSNTPMRRALVGVARAFLVRDTRNRLNECFS